MNKKRTVIIAGLLVVSTIVLSGQIIRAQTPPDGTGQQLPRSGISLRETTTSTPIDKDVQNLKDKIATKVSQLQKEGGSIVAGTITSVKKDSIELSGEAEKTYKIVLDDTLTSVSEINGTVKKDIKIADLAKGDYIFVSGPLVENTVTANAVYRDTPYFVGSGQITSVDTDSVALDIVTTDKEELTIDMSKKIRPKIMDSKTLEIGRTTLAKIQAGDTIHFVATRTDDKKKISGVSVLIIPQEFFSGK